MSAKRLTIRVEPEVERLLVWQVAHDYPGAPWALETLQDNSIILRIEQYGETIAYVWALWRFPGALEFHACSSRRFWLSRELMQRLLVVAEIMGADTLLTTPCGDTAPQIRRLLHRQGFEREGATMQKRLENLDGYAVRRATDPSAPSGAARATTSDTCNGDDPSLV
jgi:hypothetical protein